MKLFIANCTKQHHSFQYWMAGNPRIIARPIPSGTQIQIEGSVEELEAITLQHRNYGLVEISEVEREPRFSGMAYCFDKPINIDRLKTYIEKRKDAEEERSQEVRETTAVATDAKIDEIARQRGIAHGSTVIEIEEKQRRGDEHMRAPLKQKLEVGEPDERKPRGRPRKAA